MSRLLVIDDDPIIRQMCKAYFVSKGHEVLTAVDGKDGIDKFRAGPFDLVIVDLMMPNIHGFEVIDFIRTSVKGVKTPIVLLSADRKEPHLETYERRGFEDDHVDKPFDIPDLERRVNELLAEGKERD